MSLKKKYKIKKIIFPEIISKGKMFHSPHFTVRILQKKGEESHNPLFSFIVSSKITPKATDRNLLKRRGYAVIRKVLNNITARNYSYAFFFKKGATNLSFQDIEEEIIFLLKKVNTLSVSV